MKERVGPSISWLTNLDNGKQCGNGKYRLLGIDRYIENNPIPNKRFTIDGKEIYARVLIQRV